MKFSLSVSALLLAAGTMVAAEDHGKCSCTDSKLTSVCDPNTGDPIWDDFANKNDVYWCEVSTRKCSGVTGCSYGSRTGEAGPNSSDSNSCLTKCRKGD
ncbi:hypothetical protein N7492_007261 [Penicillium capsulatum]|uniref:Uncharacterized protein n=1 Tax=Penicillium capsulatum TaxID=69766 RepID=A0A9W9LLI5_9EURO|nr:hypothetical protein N7492_007261 [Penicillium capsulatum]KAJ6117099.1 hypothetical protein N7512_006824 [Penicillium capsulatum]